MSVDIKKLFNDELPAAQTGDHERVSGLRVLVAMPPADIPANEESRRRSAQAVSNSKRLRRSMSAS